MALSSVLRLQIGKGRSAGKKVGEIVVAWIRGQSASSGSGEKYSGSGYIFEPTRLDGLDIGCEKKGSQR